MASPSDPPTLRAGDTEQFPVTRVSTAAATDTDDVPSTGGPAHAVTAGTPGISRGGWWAITIAAAVLLVLGFLLTFGPARYWTPVPVVFLGYFLISGLIGLVFWKGVRELRDTNPTLHSGDGPASPDARVAAAIGAVGVASALVLLPAGLTDAPANAAPCPDGSNTCGPQPTMGPQPTQGNGGNTTAPQAPNTTVPGYTPPDTPPQQGSGSTPTAQGQVPTMPTGESPSNGCILNCGPTQAPQTGQANPPQTAQNPVTTAPNTPATTPQAPTTTPQLRTPTPETTTSTTSSKARDREDDQQRSSDEDRDKNSPYPYQAAELAAVAGTYRRRKISESAVRSGRVVSENVTRSLYSNGTVVSGPVRGIPIDTPHTDWIRAAEFITQKMKENALGNDVRLQKLGLRSASPIAMAASGLRFARLNLSHAQWDYKDVLNPMFGGSRDVTAFLVYPEDPKWRVAADIWTNIHFGYIGRQIGYPEEVLIAASHAAGDPDPNDDLAVRIGYRWGGIDPETLSVDDTLRMAGEVSQALIAKEAGGNDIFQVRPA
ncbi:polymorphic toxin type 44 domain-containing protein [Tsukamurella hominis]|uniref:polymorphic toxin type 44 domain-containing protein n=1 Tax=Tsukamurella hominis TaxID=1970232 RepID=UPI0039EC0EF0